MVVFMNNVGFLETRLVKHCLETFYGLGHQQSSRILAKYSIYPRAKMSELPTKITLALTAELSNMTIDSDARRKIVDSIRRLKDMGTYRGRRHAMGLPTRGQNTKSQIMSARKLNRVERKG